MIRTDFVTDLTKALTRLPHRNYVIDSRSKFLSEQISLSRQVINAYTIYAEDLSQFIRDHSLTSGQLPAFLKIGEEKLIANLINTFETGISQIIEIATAPSERILENAVKGVVGEVNILKMKLNPGTIRGATIKSYYIKVNQEALKFYRTTSKITLSKAVWHTVSDTTQALSGVIRNSIAAKMDSFQTARLLKNYIIHGGTAQKPLIRKLIGGGVKKYYVPKDVKYEALRLVRTETSLAYAEGVYKGGQANPFYKGINWILSASHAITDECDDYADQGFFPAGEEPFPPHPQCMCVQVPVYDSPENASNNFKEWLNDPSSQPNIESWFNNQFVPTMGGG